MHTPGPRPGGPAPRPRPVGRIGRIGRLPGLCVAAAVPLLAGVTQVLACDTTRPLAAPATPAVVQRAAAATDAASTAAWWTGTKTPYDLTRGPGAVTPPPPGARPVSTQLVARHGARAATDEDDPRLVLAVLDAARTQGGDTVATAAVRADVTAVQAAGRAVGAGRLSSIGRREHAELAARLATRMAALFTPGGAGSVTVLNSGKDRAVDSSQIFADSLAAASPGLAVTPPSADPTTLYFHKSDTAYQDFTAHDEQLRRTEQTLLTAPATTAAARALLAPVLSPAFLQQLDVAGVAVVVDPTTGESSHPDTVTVARALYHVAQIAPGLADDGAPDLAARLPADALAALAVVDDGEDFYEKGPSFAGRTITFGMAGVLLADLKSAVARVAAGDRTERARLRFAHAETLIPLEALLRLPGSDRQLDDATPFTAGTSGWHGSQVSPYTGNLQWDVFSLPDGGLVLRQLLQERETALPLPCTPIEPGSPFYRWDEMLRCLP